jgi:uncharacterized protein
MQDTPTCVARVTTYDHSPLSQIEDLDDATCIGLWSQSQFGRVGVTVTALPAILPVLHRGIDNQVRFLTGDGSKLTAALSETVVAFEVDEVEPVTSTGGSLQIVGIARASLSSSDELATALVGLPWATGDRPWLVTICPERITGRSLVTSTS